MFKIPSNRKRILVTAAIVVAALAGPVAPAMAQVAIPLGPQVLIPPSPQPGQCKAQPELVYATSRTAARAGWEAAVLAKFGFNWANWALSASKAIVPVHGGNVWLAAGRPCFYHPVP